MNKYSKRCCFACKIKIIPSEFMQSSSKSSIIVKINVFSIQLPCSIHSNSPHFGMPFEFVATKEDNFACYP